jgi:hypothetical protein
MRQRRMRPEQLIHQTVFAHIRARGVPGLVAFHPANGGYRKPVEAAILKGCGVTAGAPDLLLWHSGRSFALELKVEGGRATEMQLKMLNDLSMAGVCTAIATGLDEALTILHDWGLLRGRLQ